MGTPQCEGARQQSHTTNLYATSMKTGFYFILLVAFVFGITRGFPQRSRGRQRTSCAICVDKDKVRRTQQALKDNGPTYFTRPNEFSGLTFQQFAARYTGLGRLGGGGGLLGR